VLLRSIANLTLAAAIAVLILKLGHVAGIDLNSSSAEVQGAMTVLVAYILRRLGIDDSPVSPPAPPKEGAGTG
jgi:hypothetical protein